MKIARGLSTIIEAAARECAVAARRGVPASPSGAAEILRQRLDAMRRAGRHREAEAAGRACADRAQKLVEELEPAGSARAELPPELEARIRHVAGLVKQVLTQYGGSGTASFRGPRTLYFAYGPSPVYAQARDGFAALAAEIKKLAEREPLTALAAEDLLFAAIGTPTATAPLERVAAELAGV